MLGPAGQRRVLTALGHSDDQVVLLNSSSVLGVFPVDRGYPTLDDRDSANPGKGQFVVTWRVTLPEGHILGNAVQSAQVRDSQNGELVVVGEFPLPVAKVPGKQLLVYINEYVRSK